MSQRVKRPNRSDDGSVPAKRRKRPTTCTQQEEEDTASLASWRPPLNHDLKTIYNRLSAEAPAELFRKDLISAMKLPDSEPLACDEYWVIVDQWKQEWERGVQVPVNPDSLPEPSVTVTQCSGSGGGGSGVDRVKPSQDFKLPKNKYVRITKDDHFKSEEHIFSSAPAQAEAACSYDLDECDVEWLKLLNAERLASGQGTITEDQLERVMERLELRCWDKIQSILKTEEGLGIEFDENVICDVCRSPDSEEGNEMVFCDSCNICVHQACYGITQIPEGQWLCCTCALSKRPECVLCPNKGGAMKCTKSGLKWAHVSCALWIPEVSIGCVEKMEPITKISSIPQSRWALICVLCRDRIGACIQCSVKTCKTAYHVTCAFKHGLEMRAIIEDENADDGVKLRSYCEKHSKSSKKEKNVCSSSEDDDSKRKKRKDMTSEEKNQARAARSHEIEAEFYKHVSAKDIAVQIEVDSEALQYIYNYWKLKRKAGHNKPLLPPKSEDIDMLSHQQEQADLEKMKMFVQLRQDLERVRNLCYMVSRREKLSRSFFKLREQTFYKQVSVIQSANGTLTSSVLEAVLEANHGPSIYDTLYSNGVPEDNTCNFNTILARIAGSTSPTPNEQKSDVNGLFKDVKNNPYKKLYFNGSSKRKSGSLYGSGLSSAGSSDEQPKDNKENRLLSSEEDVKPVITSSRKKVQNKKSISKKRYSANISKIDSSSEEDVKDVKSITKLYNNSGLKQIENELSISASDSDELILISSKNVNQKKSVNSIYSDTDSTDVSLKNDDRSSNADSQQSRLRTKAAVKDFSHKIGTKSPTKGGSDFKRRVKEEKKSDTKKKDPFDASELIVPQRQAAKKASENLKSTTGRTKEHAMSNDVEAISVAPNEEKERHNKNKLKLGRPHKEKEKNVKHETHSEVKCKEDTKIRDDKSKDSKKDVDKDAKIEVDIDKDVEKNDPDVLAYVPQRQAAKKAAEHIKSGLGKPGVQEVQPVVDDKEKVKKEAESTRLRKENEVKLSKESEKSKRIIEQTHKSSSNSTSSSSSSSSTDSSCSSTSDSEDVSVRKPRSESHLAALDNKRTTEAKDWPFLDKGAKSTASISSTDTSDSSRSTSPKSHALSKSEQKAKSTNMYSENLSKEPQDVAVVTDHKNDHRERSQQQQTSEKHISRTSPDKSCTKTVDKKPAVVKREEPVRNRGKAAKSSRGRARITNTCDRIGSVDVRSGDLTECSSNKPDQPKARTRKSDSGISDKTIQSNSTCSPLRENDQKVLDETEPEPSYLEKEILERKANRDSMGKSRLDQIFSPIDKSDVQSTSSFKIRQPTFKELDTITIEPDKSPISEENMDDGLMTRSPILHKSLDEYTDKKVEDPVKLIELENDILSNTSEIKHSETLTSQSDVLDEISFEKEETKESNIQSDLFSNQKDQDLLADFDNILDDGFDMSKDDEPINTNLSFSFGNVNYIKEDSKEESARETLNLVEKLRMGLSKKSTSCDVEDTVSVSSSSKNDTDRIDLCEQIVPNNIIESSLSKENIAKIVEQPQINLEMKVEVTDTSTFQSAKEQNYNFLSCNADVPLVSAELPQKECNVDDRHTVTTEADERWVPPSNLSSNATSPKIIPDASTPLIVEPYIQNDYQSQSSVSLPLQSRSIDDIKTPDRRITQTPFLDPASMDYTAMDIHPSAKWNENHLMPSRRSSSSSNSSTRSNSPQRIELNDENVFKRQEMMNHPIDMAYNLPPFQQNAIDPFPQFSEASQFVSTPVSLFPPSGINTQLPFPSPGTPIFPPSYGATYQPPHSVIETMSKPTEEPMSFSTACTAAFTSSHHNMAFTAAMVNMRKDTLPNENTSELSSSNPMLDISNEDILPSPIINYNATSYVEPSPNPSVKSNSSTGKKSPSKPTRTSARFISLQQSKSPSKSPAKSPRQEHAKRSSRGKGVASRGSQNQSRGRGRGKGRGKSISQPEHDNPYTIHNKLIGTVYDLNFDDDISKDNIADLRAMRERRKSVDVHDRKSDTPKEISMSPKFQSPSQSYKNKSFNTDLRDLRPPTPIKEPPKAISPEPTPVFTDIVQPVLPGPVDMRTYNNTFESHNYESNLLTVFGTTGTAQQLHEDIDEELEKEFHSALTADNKKVEEPAPVLEISNMKVSLSDSRNQLKVKIKGPIANYTSSVIPPLPPVIDALIPSNIASIASVSNNSMLNSTPNMSTGTSNLRRMRKKELLRQYCSQDMNMDDPVQVSGFPTVITPSISRTIITIPKAVASMTTIPTKDDYRDYRTSTEDILDTKIRKEKSRPGLSRELRQLDVVLDDDNSRRHTTMNMTTINLVSNDSKRRGRPPRSIQSNVAPKLKIKIGGNSIVGPTRIDDKRDRIRPPKKRLSIIAMPTVEDLKRESMKFRKQIMADFGEKRKKDKDKGDKKNKKKKKQDKQAQIVANETSNPTKLIIRFGKKMESDSENKRSDSGVEVDNSNISEDREKSSLSLSGENTNCDVDHHQMGERVVNRANSSETSTLSLRAVRSSKVSPIKLKLSRCQKGSGYVMKGDSEDGPPRDPLASAIPLDLLHTTTSTSSPPPSPTTPLLHNVQAVASSPPPAPTPSLIHQPTPLPALPKDCEVR